MQLLKDIKMFINNEMDSNGFEDKVRELFWTSGYIIITVDKLVQAIIKQVNRTLNTLDSTRSGRPEVSRADCNL